MENALPPLLQNALQALDETGRQAAVLCAPFPVTTTESSIILAHPSVHGLIVRDPSFHENPVADGKVKRVGELFATLRYQWKAPLLVYVGLPGNVPRSVRAMASNNGVRRILYQTNNGWRYRHVLTIDAFAIGYRARQFFLRKFYKFLDKLACHVQGIGKFYFSNVAPRNFGNIFNALPRRSREFNDPKSVMMYVGALGAGGAERQLVNTALALRERGVSVSVACLSLDNPFHASTLRAAGVAILEAPEASESSDIILRDLPPSVVEKIAKIPREIQPAATTLYYLLRQQRPDVLHCWMDYCNTVGCLAGLLSETPSIVMSGRSLAPYHYKFYSSHFRPIYVEAVKRPEVTLINNSRAGARDYANWINVAEQSIKVIPNGIDLTRMESPSSSRVEQFRQSLSIPEEAPLVCGVMTLYALKRPLLWVDVAARLFELVPDAHFVVAGDGPMKSAVEKRILKHGLAGRVHLLGRAKDVALVIRSSQALLLTSAYEGLPNVLLEAQWMGVPVVTTDVGGAREAVSEGVTGLVASKPNPTILAAALHEVLSYDQWADRVRDEGPKMVCARFSIDKMLDSTLDVYRGGSEI